MFSASPVIAPTIAARQSDQMLFNRKEIEHLLNEPFERKVQANLDPGAQLHDIEAAFTTFELAHLGLGDPEVACQFSLRKPDLTPRLDQQFKEDDLLSRIGGALQGECALAKPATVIAFAT